MGDAARAVVVEVEEVGLCRKSRSGRMQLELREKESMGCGGSK